VQLNVGNAYYTRLLDVQMNCPEQAWIELMNLVDLTFQVQEGVVDIGRYKYKTLCLRHDNSEDALTFVRTVNLRGNSPLPRGLPKP